MGPALFFRLFRRQQLTTLIKKNFVRSFPYEVFIPHSFALESRELIMQIDRITRRVLDPVFLFGRFHSVRQLYSAYMAVVDGPPIRTTKSSWLFPNINVRDAVKDIRKEAVHVGNLRLPRPLIEEIVAFSKAASLHPVRDPNGKTFKYDEVRRGSCQDGRRVPIGGVPNPESCSAVMEIINDAALRAIVREYLGYEPKKRVTILDWTFATDFTREECRGLNYFVTDYHYDINGFNFVHVYFYLTDTDKGSGAHVMMRRSHNHKPLRMLFGATSASEEAVWTEYGREHELIVEGPAGMGFVQDASCYHRASQARDGDRLMLAIRYS